MKYKIYQVLTKTISIIIISFSFSQSGYTQISSKNELINSSQAKATQTVKKINWESIDKKETVEVNNYPNYNSKLTNNSYVNAGVHFFNVSENQSRRILIIQNALHQDSLIPELKNQLKDDFVEVGTEIYNPYNPQNLPNQRTLTDEEAVNGFYVWITTRKNVVSEVHEYIFTEGLAKGFSVPVYILPVADKNKSEIKTLLSDKKFDEFCQQVIAKNGGEMQFMSFNSRQNTIEVDAFFPNANLKLNSLSEMEKQLSKKIGMNVKISPLKEKLRVIAIQK